MYVFIYLVKFGSLSGRLSGNSYSFGLHYVPFAKFKDMGPGIQT